MIGRLGACLHPKRTDRADLAYPWHDFDACFGNLFCLLCLLWALCNVLAELFLPD